MPETQLEFFDYRSIEAADRGFVKQRALLIREAAKRTAQGIVLIGQWLSEVKEKLPHGAWLPWLKGEFGWSDFTAKAMMRVYRQFKSENFSDLEIDVSALYLIAAPSTPEPVVKEVIERARNGEPMSRAKAVEVLESFRARAELPTPAVARQIAIATGKHTAATNGLYIPPCTTEEQKQATEERMPISVVLVSIRALANTQVDPGELRQFLLAQSRKMIHVEIEDVQNDSQAALDWLGRFVKEIQNDQP